MILGIALHAPRSVGKSVKEWTLTLPREFPLWELESRWIPKFSASNYRGQNSMDWGFPYIIEKLLERRYLKWDCMTHLETSNTSYSQKKGRESNWQFDSRPLKVENHPHFPRVQVVCNILLERSRQGLKLCFRPHLNQRSTRKIMDPQICKSPNCGNFETPNRKSQDKMTFEC